MNRKPFFHRVRSELDAGNPREEILAAARLLDPEIGDGAMIVQMEWGYWIGSIYISKNEL